MFGDIDIRSGGEIRGDAISISGNIYTEEGSIITGESIEASWRKFARYDNYRYSSSRTRRFRYSYSYDAGIYDYPDEVVFDYNRVDGLFFGFNIGPNISRYSSYDYRPLNLFGFFGYGFKSAKWRYQIGLEKLFGNYNPFSIGFELHSVTDSDDNWIISKTENALAASMIKEDFRDYFEREGYAGFISQRIGDYFTMKFQYRIDNYESLQEKASWSLFGGKKEFRENPPINEGEMKSALFDFNYDNRSNHYFPYQGWHVNLSGEVSNEDLGGDFNFKRAILDIRRYQPLSRYESFNFRIRIGTSENILPLQKLFYLGGIGTLRGFGYKEFFGNRLFLTNLEYRFDPERILIGPPSWFIDDSFDIILFSDYGLSWYSEPDADMMNVFSGTKFKDLKSSIGFGLGDKEDHLRLNFAWRTDTKEKKVSVYLRLKQTF